MYLSPSRLANPGVDYPGCPREPIAVRVGPGMVGALPPMNYVAAGAGSMNEIGLPGAWA